MISRRAMITGSIGMMGATMFGTQTHSYSPKLHVPAEDTPHELTIMQWPNHRDVYRDRVFLEMVQDTIVEVANTISEFEPVALLADKKFHGSLKRRLSSNVELWDVPTEDLWARDSGPLFAIDENGELVISHLKFNGWGNKQIHTHDGKIAERVAERLGIPVIPSGLVGEAGGLDHDGKDYLIAHESSWLIDNRNPGITRDEIEQKLLAAYGAKKMIWAKGVYDEDITDYHIDSLARFTGPERILINLPDEPDPYDPFHSAALETHDALVAAGMDVEIIPEPNKRRIKSIDFVASYANYYVCNGGVISAEFGDRETDEIARDALKRHHPGREIIQLNVDPLGEIGGGIHCATQQMPKI